MTHSIAKTAAAAAAALIATAFPFATIAQNSNNSPVAPNLYERNVYQQQRIEQGLKDGSLTVQEAANLERGQARVERMESRALADGKLTGAEKTRINDAQNRQSATIDRERNDNQRGDPNSRSSQRMQAGVQRNVNEQQRIAQGVQSGQITNREASRLERGQSQVSSMEARAGRDGNINRNEQRVIQGAGNHQSQNIYRQSHDAQTRNNAQGQQHQTQHNSQHNWSHNTHQSGQRQNSWQHHGSSHNHSSNQHYGRNNYGNRSNQYSDQYAHNNNGRSNRR